MKCKDCGKSFAYLDTSCSWSAKCDLLGTAQVIGDCYGGDGESMCNCSDQKPPDWDCDLGKHNANCPYHES